MTNQAITVMIHQSRTVTMHQSRTVMMDIALSTVPPGLGQLISTLTVENVLHLMNETHKPNN